MKEIQLTQGKIALIDDEYFDRVNQYKWFAVKANNTFYASTWVGEWRQRKPLRLHHLIAGFPADGMFVDNPEQVPKTEFPFTTTIVKDNDRFEFT